MPDIRKEIIMSGTEISGDKTIVRNRHMLVKMTKVGDDYAI
jgi:hypothetical protein